MKRPGIDDSKLPVTVAHQTFNDLDADGDGVITRAEWDAAVGSVVLVPPTSQKPRAPMSTGGGGAAMRLRGKSYETMGSSVNQVGAAIGGRAEAPHGGRGPKPQVFGSGAYDSSEEVVQEPGSVHMKEEQGTQLQSGGSAAPTSHRLATKDLIAPAEDNDDDASEHYRKPYAPHVANMESDPGVDDHDWEALDGRLKSGERIGVSPNVLLRFRHGDDASQATAQHIAAYPGPSGGARRLVTATGKTERSAEASRSLQAREESDYTEEVASRSHTNSYQSSPPLVKEHCLPQSGMKSRPPVHGQAAGAAAMEQASCAPQVPDVRSNRQAWAEPGDSDERARGVQHAQNREPAGRGPAGGFNVGEASYGARPLSRPHRGQMEAPSIADSEELVRKLDKGINLAEDQSDYYFQPDLETYSTLTPIILDQFRERLEGMTKEHIRHANELLRKEIGVLRLEVDRRRGDLRQKNRQIAAN